MPTAFLMGTHRLSSGCAWCLQWQGGPAQDAAWTQTPCRHGTQADWLSSLASCPPCSSGARSIKQRHSTKYTLLFKKPLSESCSQAGLTSDANHAAHIVLGRKGACTGAMRLQISRYNTCAQEMADVHCLGCSAVQTSMHKS